MDYKEICILIISIAIPISIAIYAHIVLSRTIVNHPEAIPPEYKPPKGLNSAEVGYIYRNYLCSIDIISLIPYLASKGYIKILGVEKNQKNTKDDTIIIMKDYDGTNEVEKLFMSYLLSVCTDTKIEGGIGEVSSDKIRKIIYNEGLTIGLEIKRRFKPKNQEESKETTLLFVLMIIATCASVLPILADKVAFLTEGSFILWALSIPIMLVLSIGNPISIFLFSIIAVFVEVLSERKSETTFIRGRSVKKSHPLNLIIPMIMLLVFCVMAIGLVMAFTEFKPMLVLPLIIDTPIIIYLFVILHKIEHKRTNEEMEYYKKILGFRRYLEDVERDRVKQFASEDPKLYYEIIAYSYALEIATDWVDEFEAGIINDNTNTD